jgi:hypothetical protein
MGWPCTLTGRPACCPFGLASMPRALKCSTITNYLIERMHGKGSLLGSATNSALINDSNNASMYGTTSVSLHIYSQAGISPLFLKIENVSLFDFHVHGIASSF